MIAVETTNTIGAPEARSHSQATERIVASVWWLNPAVLFTVVVAGTLLPALAMSDRAYALYKTPKYVNGDAVWLGLLACLMVGCGAMLAAHAPTSMPRLTPSSRRRLVPWFYITSALTLLGYAVWMASGIQHGFSAGHIVQMISGADEDTYSALKFEIFRTIPGITTCSQFALLAVMLGVLVRGRETPYLKPLLAAILLVSAIRMVLVSERLAFVEVALLVGLVWLRTRILSRERSPRAQWALSLAPAIGVLGLVILFGGAEYFRSWTFYKDEVDSFVEFTVSRLSGYYSTGHNNGAMECAMHEGLPLPYYTLEWFWRFPFLKGSPLSYETVTGVDPQQAHAAFLDRWGNEEFNNPGGLFCPTLDYGVFGGAIFWLAFGLIAGRLYRHFLAGTLVGLLAYPVIVLSILEVPRILYLCTVRPFPALVMAAFLVLPQMLARTGASHAN